MNKLVKWILLTAFFGLCVMLSACGGKTTTAEPTAEPEILPEIQISELMGKNRSTLALPDGSFPSWLELENRGSESVNLDSFRLRCGKHTATLSDLVLAPGEYLLLILSDSERESPEPVYVDLSLGDGGELLQLLSPRGAEIDSMITPEWAKDVSYVRTAEGDTEAARWPTPERENSESGFLAFQEKYAYPVQDLAIGEAMVYNSWYSAPDGQCYDWVEITNFTDQSLNLSDYYLSDKEKERTRFALPSHKLNPGESTVVYCAEDSENPEYAPFGLSSGGESLYLTRKDGTLCDYLCLKDIPLGCSMGRMRGKNGAFYFASPSPGRENSGGVRLVGEAPVSLREDGVFNGTTGITVELAGEGTIRYTLDGSMPNENSSVYTGPFTVSQTGVVRARSYREGCLPSKALSLSYILNEEHSLPIVSMVCDPNEMFGEAGIYTNPMEKREIPGCLMFYGDTDSFRLDCGIKLHGATSRLAQSKKSFKILFRDRYEGRLHDDLFDNGVTEFSSILLRAAQESDQSTYMRDNLMHQLSLQAFPELPAQDYRYAVLYLNGEYRGIYNIREAHSTTHYAEHYGYDEDTVSHWQAEWPEDSLPAEIYEFASEHDLRSEENYTMVSRYVDTDSVIAWCIMQVYSGNFDFNSPNMRFYFSTQDQKLRYALVDLDLGMFDYGSFLDVFSFGYAYDYLASYLMQNAGFRHRFIQMLAEALQGPLSDKNALALIDQLANELQPEIERDRMLWGGTYSDWERMVEHLREYITFNQGRAKNVEELLRVSGFVKEGEMDAFFPE